MTTIRSIKSLRSNQENHSSRSSNVHIARSTAAIEMQYLQHDAENINKPSKIENEAPMITLQQIEEEDARSMAVIEMQHLQHDAENVNKPSKMKNEVPMVTLQQLEEEDGSINNSSSEQIFSTTTTQISLDKIYNVTLSTIHSGRNVTNELPPGIVTLIIFTSICVPLTLLCICFLPCVRHRIVFCCRGFAVCKSQSNNRTRRSGP